VDGGAQAAGMTPSHCLRLAAGRTVLWRSNRSLQVGIDPRHAVVINGLSTGQVEVVRRLDGRHGTDDLLAIASAAGTDHAATLRLLDELAGAGLIEPTDRAELTTPALTPDATSWALRTGRAPDELMTRRAMATVEVYGDGRIAVGVATLLAAAGVGTVIVHATGRVNSQDVGTGYLPRDVTRSRRAAAAHAVHRARTVANADPSPVVPDVAVLADTAVWDPHVALRLANEWVPHLAVHARETSMVVGPLVLPGRTSCLRCADLHRADADPCWPRLAAQLATLPSAVELACAQIAAGMAAEQVLALLTGRGEAPDEPPAAGATFELDPLHGELVRRRWPPHPRCGCGAAPVATGSVVKTRPRDTRQSGM
jgi:bacteriocin biosynthesis cyclodehydratase domain-containing protein